MALLRIALVASLALAGCYSPKITECTISCGAGGACPNGLACLSDGFCHDDNGTPNCGLGGTVDAAVAVDSRKGADAPMMSTVDGRTIDAPMMNTVDARPGEPDARRFDARPGEPDAATMPDAGTTGCTNFIGFVEHSGGEDGITGNLSLTKEGVAHVTYYDETNKVLRYAHGTPRNSSWQFETVGPGTEYLKGQTLDAQGGLHVVYTERLPTPRLSYAYRPPGASQSWGLETIDDTALAIDGTIVVDADGAVHVAYWYNLTDLNYAVRLAPGGEWFGEPIDTVGVVGEHPSMVMDSDGVLHVTYRVAGTSNDVGYAVLDPLLPIWQTTRLDTAENVGAYTALAVDDADALHVVYSDLFNETLRYGFLPLGASDRFTTADSKKFVGRFNSIAVDSAGGVHVATYDYGARDLRYGYRARGGSGFTFTTIDSEGDVGRHTSIAVDASGASHIVYTDDTHGDLKYAIVCP